MTITVDDIIDIVHSITYKPGWRILLGSGGDKGGRYYIQVVVDETAGIDSVTKKPTSWKSGKRYLSPFMCKQEIVGVCFSIIKEAEEHEMREWFRYKGRSIYNPHLSPDALAEFAAVGSNFNYREDAMSMAEKEEKK